MAFAIKASEPAFALANGDLSVLLQVGKTKLTDPL